jgi:uncharacterized protein (TIGR02147 family)
MPDIYLYSDYRRFLQDYYDLNKAADYHFSFRYLSMRAGFSSSGYYKRIMQGIRNLSVQAAERTCEALGLAGEKGRYFMMLVFLDRAGTTMNREVPQAG